jgi:hypothetical protein
MRPPSCARVIEEKALANLFGSRTSTEWTVSIFRDPHSWGADAIMVGMLAWEYYFLYSLRLILTDDRIIYQIKWRSKEIPLSTVKSIEWGPRLFGAKVRWAVHSHDSPEPIILNVNSFDRRELKNFAKVLSERYPEIPLRGL